MTRALLASLCAGLVLAGAAHAKGPHAILIPGPEAPEAGRPWEATLELMEFVREPEVTMIARRGRDKVVARLRRAPSDFQEVRRYSARLAFPSDGRWELRAVSGTRRFEFEPVAVGSGRVPRDYVAFAVGSRAYREGAGGVYYRSGDSAPSSGGSPLPPEEFSVAAEPSGDGDGPPLWLLLPAAGVLLGGAGVLRRRAR